jgi:hypothetical protein
MVYGGGCGSVLDAESPPFCDDDWLKVKLSAARADGKSISPNQNFYENYVWLDK